MSAGPGPLSLSARRWPSPPVSSHSPSTHICVLTPCSYKDARHVGRGPPIQPHVTITASLKKDLISKDSPTLRSWKLGFPYEFWGTQFNLSQMVLDITPANFLNLCCIFEKLYSIQNNHFVNISYFFPGIVYEILITLPPQQGHA